MRRHVILDTGPLVAFLNSRDRHHDWVVAQWSSISPPFLTCEAVVSEACFLLRGWHNGAASIFELFERKILSTSFSLTENVGAVFALLKKYSDIPMSMADACLVRMTELHEASSILTLDADFKIYRKHKHRAISLLTPADND